MPEDVSQDDIDKLLEEALGGPTSSLKDDSGGSEEESPNQSQAGIDALLTDAMGGDSAGAEEPPESGSGESDIDALLSGGDSESSAKGDDLGQDDIDSLLAGSGGDEEKPGSETKEHSQEDIDALLGVGSEDSEPIAAESESAETADADDGAQSQDDIDALLSGALGDDEGDSSATEEEPVEDTGGGAQSQDDIDALLSGALGEEEPSAEAAVEAGAEEDDGAQSQDDIDALLSGALGDEDPSAEGAVESDTEEGEGTQSQDDIDSLLSGAVGEDSEAPVQPDKSKSESDQTLIADSGALGELQEASLIEEQDSGEEYSGTAAEEGAVDSEEEEMGTVEDLADLLGRDDSSDAEEKSFEDSTEEGLDQDIASPEPEHGLDDILSEFSGDDEKDLDKTTDLGMGDSLDNILSAEGSSLDTPDAADISSTVSQAFDEVSPALESALKEPAKDQEKEDILRAAAPSSGRASGIIDDIDENYKIDISSISDSLNLLQSGSEIEGITGEIASLLGQLSERARKYQSAYQGSNQEITDLRSRLRAAEKRLSLLSTEKISLQEEMTVLRSRLSSTEEEHVNYVEKTQSDISALQVKVRERDNRLRQFESEIESLNSELKNSHTSAANSDVESRRAMFELERIRSEHEAEKQERIRLQRMLDTREQEIQAIQSRSAGEASSLFMDELHRLIRRLESELNVRTGAAREALSALDLVSGSSDNPQAISVARKNLLVASGVDENSDALKELSRLQGMPGGERSASGGSLDSGQFAVNLDDFSADLNNLEMEEACLKAGRILSEKTAPPVAVMDRIYNSPPLKTENASRHLVAIMMLFKNIDQAQKKADAERGRETSDTEKVYVMMFDMLHYLVRIKAINKSTPEAWGFFLDVRGRYSFITSDAQWTAYRDKQLK